MSGPSKQVSYLSQAWMILSETLNAKEGVRAMKKQCQCLNPVIRGVLMPIII